MSDIRKKIFLDDLPPDVIQNPLAEHLPPEDLSILSKVSRYFHNIFTSENPWKTNLVSQFGFSPEDLKRLEKLRNAGKISCNFREAHHRYGKLVKFKSTDPYTFQYLLDIHIDSPELDKFMRWLYIPTNNPNLKFFLLASCTNDRFFLSWIPRELRFHFHAWCILAGTNVLDETYLYECSKRQLEHLMRLAIVAGNTTSLARLLKLTDETGQPRLIPNASILNIAIQKNDMKLAREIFARLRPSLTGRKLRFDAIAISGNKKLFSELLQLTDQSGIPLCIPTTKDFMTAALLKCNVIFHYLLEFKDKYGNFIFKPDSQILVAAINGHNDELISELLALNLATSDVVTALIRAGYSDKARALLNLKDQHSQTVFVPTWKDVLAAAQAGDLNLFRELIAPRDENGIPIILHTKTLPISYADLLSEILSFSHHTPTTFFEILAINDNQGHPLAKLDKKIFFIWALEASDVDFAIKQLMLTDKDGNYKFEVGDILASVTNPLLFRRLLTLTNKDGTLRFLPSTHHLELAVVKSSLILHELLALKDENGNPLLTPSYAMLLKAINHLKLESMLELLACKKANGEPILIPTEETTLHTQQEVDSTHVNILCCYRAMALAQISLIKDKNLNEAATQLQIAYRSSAVIFFREIEFLLKNSQSTLDAKTLEFWQTTMISLMKAELSRDTPSGWSLEKFASMKNWLLATEQNKSSLGTPFVSRNK